jgi:AbrB family looped-hinge helix DNA binding protein
MAVFRAKVTSKGQITIPLEVRKRLGVRPGEQVEFDTAYPYTVIRPVRTDDNPFEKWRGIAKGAFPGGLKEINAWIREMRGTDEESD